MTRDQSLCFGKSPDSLTGRSTAARMASASLANAALGVNNIASPSGKDDRSGPRPGARPSGQARDQSGGPAAVQPGDRYRRRAAPLCPRARINVARSDRFRRRRRPGHHHALAAGPGEESQRFRRAHAALRLTGNPTFLFCRLYHFDLPHNFLQKTRNFLESCLRNHQCGLAVIPAKQDGYHSRSGGEFGPRINLS